MSEWFGEWVPWSNENSAMKRLHDDFIVYLSRNWSHAPGKYIGSLFREGKVVKEYECLLFGGCAVRGERTIGRHLQLQDLL
jgi:hypothetical protein